MPAGRPRHYHDPEMVAAARAIYEGVGLTVDDRARMTGDAIAEAFGVHPHTIDAWIKRGGWARPAWYSLKGPRWRQGRAGPEELLALIRAAAGLPCPSNVTLAKATGVTADTIKHRLRSLYKSGDVVSESRGAYRRLTLKDGTATGWTEEIVGRPAAWDLPHGPGGSERRSRIETAVLQILTAVARAGAPCPTNEVLATRARCAMMTARRALQRHADAGAYTIERRTLKGCRPDRRIVFAPSDKCPGMATAWAGGGAAPAGMIDYAARAAVTSLQRQGIVTFDVAVHTGRGWGIAWSVDGKVMGRGDLIAFADHRQARAIAQLQQRASEGPGAAA